MASLRKRPKSDFWVCCYTSSDGRRTQRSTGTADKDQAMMVCRQWEGEARMEREKFETAAMDSGRGKGRRIIWAAAAIAVLLQIGALLWFMNREPAPVSLLVELDASEQVPDSFMEQQFAKRHRWVRINEDALKVFDERTWRFELNLFDDEKHLVDVGAYRKHHTGAKSILGLIENDLHTSVVLSRRDSRREAMAGSIALADGRRFMITHVGDGKHVVVEVDMTIAPPHINHASTLQPRRGTPSGGDQPGKGKGKGNKAKGIGISVGANDYRYGKPQTEFALKKGPAYPFLNSMALARKFAFTAGGGGNTTGNATGPQINASNLTNAYGFYGHGERGYPGTNEPWFPLQFPIQRYPGFGGSVFTEGPMSPSRILFQRAGRVEFIDVMFVYESNLLMNDFNGTVLGTPQALADMQLKVDNLIEDTNMIFKKCLIPMEIRQAVLDSSNLNPITQLPAVNENTLFMAKARHFGTDINARFPGPTLDACATARVAHALIDVPVDQVIGANTLNPPSPAWELQSAGVQPIYDSVITSVTYGTWSWGTTATYVPLYEIPDFQDSPAAALQWITDSRNSLIYGDQYWPEPYINFPEGYTWDLIPAALDINATRNVGGFFAPSGDVGPTVANPILFFSAENPDIYWGPMDDGGYMPFDTNASGPPYSAAGPPFFFTPPQVGQLLTSMYGQTGLDAIANGLYQVTGEDRYYIGRDDGGSLPSYEPGFESFAAIPPAPFVGLGNAKPNYYIRNSLDGPNSYPPADSVVVGTIDAKTDVFTPLYPKDTLVDIEEGYEPFDPIFPPPIAVLKGMTAFAIHQTDPHPPFAWRHRNP